LYETTASALKRVTQRLRVGGPATAAASWIPSFLRYTAEHSVPIDFVSTHVYGNDSASQVLGTQEAVPDTEMVGRAARMVRDQVQASRAELPIVWSEYNASYKNEPDVTDSPFMAPWLANTIRQCDGLTDMMSYWTFSDVFEEQGVVKRPFYGGFGLIAAGGIPKAAFNAFALLHWLGDRRIASDSQSALVTRRADGSLVVAVWNLYPPNDRSAAAKTVHLVVRGVPGSARASISRVDSDHGSPLKAYAAMGSPDYPTRDQIAALRRAAELPPPEMRALSADGSLDIALPAQALAVVEIR
jgi:xylan 1,4-beta-xylosidase